MNLDKLNEIKEDIEKMDSCSHLEVFNILEAENISYNTNMNGIFVNLTLINEDVIHKLEKYIQYKKTQKVILNQDEHTKEQYKKEFFN
jgi:hypothetical protein